MSAGHTSRFFEPLVRRLWPSASPEAVYVLHVLVRKCGHLFEYGVVALLAYRAARAGRRPRWSLRWAVAAVTIASAFAVTDELRQSLTTTRTGTPGDVAVDVAGACLAMLTLRQLIHRDEPDEPDEQDV
jgi:VanZ family protein